MATHETQFGSGLHGVPTGTTYLLQAATVDSVLAKGLCAIASYVDIAFAFAEVQRCLVVDDPESADALLSAFVGVGMDPTLAREIVDDVASMDGGRSV